MSEVAFTGDVVSYFKKLIEQNKMAVPVASMSTLLMKIKNSKSSTWMELELELKQTMSLLKNCTYDDLNGRSGIAIGAGCDLFMKYVTVAFRRQFSDFNTCKEELFRRGANFADMSMNARARIAEVGHTFIRDNSTVLIHGHSRVVTTLILKAAETKQFKIILTESRPNRSFSMESVRIFADAGIPTTMIMDCAVGAVMETVDMVLVGAEGVMENGGIINKVGTYQVALVAKALQRPFYVAVEAYKFTRLFPLTQTDAVTLTGGSSYASDNMFIDINQLKESLPKNTSLTLPIVDFTPSDFITLLLTDLGVLTTAAVSGELIRLYQ